MTGLVEMSGGKVALSDNPYIPLRNGMWMSTKLHKNLKFLAVGDIEIDILNREHTEFRYSGVVSAMMEYVNGIRSGVHQG